MEIRLMTLIGRIERVNFPLWNMKDIEAKVDTGAYTSSIHCQNIQEIKKSGVSHVQFNLLDPEHPSYNNEIIELRLLDKRKVKSSNGRSTLRFFVQTNIQIFGKSYTIDLSLSDRSEMNYPILLGRKFLNDRFIVDVSKKYLSLNNKGS